MPYITQLHQDRLGNEAFELHYTLLSVSGVSAARRVMEALISNRYYSHIYNIAEILKHAVSCMEAAHTGQEDENWLFMEQYREKNLKDEEVSCCLNLMRTEDAFFEQLCILYGDRIGGVYKSPGRLGGWCGG